MNNNKDKDYRDLKRREERKDDKRLKRRIIRKNNRVKIKKCSQYHWCFNIKIRSDGVSCRRVVEKIKHLYPDQINHCKTKKWKFHCCCWAEDEDSNNQTLAHMMKTQENNSNHKTYQRKLKPKVENKKVVEESGWEKVWSCCKIKSKVEHKSDRK